MTITVVFALAAAFANAVNIMTQHSASVTAPERQGGWRLAVYLLRNPLWLFGSTAALAGFVFYAIALHDGQLAVVQPLLIAELVFTLVMRRVLLRQHVVGAAWASAVAIGAALRSSSLRETPTAGVQPPTRGMGLDAGGRRGQRRRRRRADLAGIPAAPAALFGIASALHLGAVCHVYQGDDRHVGDLRRVRHVPALARLRARGLRGSPVSSSSRPPPRRALERLAAPHRCRRSGRQHLPERLALRRAVHPWPAAIDGHSDRVRRDGGRGCGAVANDAHPFRRRRRPTRL